VLVTDIGDIPDTIRHCKSLQVVDLSSNPLQRFVVLCRKIPRFILVFAVSMFAEGRQRLILRQC